MSNSYTGELLVLVVFIKSTMVKCCFAPRPHSPADQAPMSFYLVRLISKTPCMVLRLGFPIGTSAHTRNKVCVYSLISVLWLHIVHLFVTKPCCIRSLMQVRLDVTCNTLFSTSDR